MLSCFFITIKLPRGQSAFVYSGDVLAFLALQSGSTSPTPFLSFKVEMLNPLIQSIRPQPVPFQASNSANGLSKSSSSASLPVAASMPQSADDLVNITHVAQAVPEKAVIQMPIGPQASFWLQVKNSKTNEPIEALMVKEPSGVLKIGRSFQPESFWRSLAPDACPAISREHFSISATRQRSGSVVEDESMFKRSYYKFYLCCNSLNGLAVLNPLLNTGGSSPVFLQKDTPGASAFEIFEGTEIELAGVIRLVFHESLNPHNGTVSTATGSGTRSINFVPAAVLRPPVSVNTAHSVKGAMATASASASFISDGEIEIDDAFSKTGFKAA